MPFVAESAQPGGGKFIKCSACGGDIPVRTFKAGNVTCPSCGTIKDLGDDLAARMRQFQANLEASPPTEAVPAAPAVMEPAPRAAGSGKVVMVVIGVAVAVSFLVWFLSASS